VLRPLLLVLPCFLAAAALAESAAPRTCRILFLEGPDGPPDTLQLFDGTSSREVELPRMNFSRIYTLPPGPLTLRLLPQPPADPEKIPPGAPSATVAADVTDLYLLVTSDTANRVAPVRMQVIDAGSNRLKQGQMLWFNLTPNAVGGIVGTQKLAIRSQSRAVLDPPASGAESYPVNLTFRIPDSEPLYPLCETQWLHDPRSRSVVFIIPSAGIRTPRVLAFPDYREKAPAAPLGG
jgi:hypothetical protein